MTLPNGRPAATLRSRRPHSRRPRTRRPTRTRARRARRPQTGDPIPEATIDLAWELLLWAGLTATLLLTWIAAAARWTGHSRLDPARLLATLLFPRPSRTATLAGLAAHLATGALLLPTAYGLLFEAAGHADAAFGLAIGAVHGTLAGLVLPLAHRHRNAEPEPGLFGRRLGPLTPAGLLAAHLLYGALLGHIYVVP